MKTNRLMPDQSIEKIWDKFRKMNGVILTFVSTNWVEQADGTFTNTVEYEGFTSKEILEVDLYDDGNLTETQISEYDGYIAAFNTNDGEIVAVASTKPTTNITVLCRGEIVTSGNGGGSVKVTKITQAAFKNLSKSQQQSGIYVIIDAEAKKISAENIKCKDADGNESNVQEVIDEQNKNLMISTKTLIVDQKIEISNDATQRYLNGTIPMTYKKYLIVAGVRYAVQNSLLIDNGVLSLLDSTNTAQVGGTWNTENSGYVNVYNGNWKCSAITKTNVFEVKIYGFN